MRRTHAFPLLAVIALSPAAYSQDRQITPDSIRVEPLRPDAEGGWITLAGYLEIGSPAISRDGQWVALDGRKAGYNFSPGEIWIARRDGSELRKLTDGATPRWSPDGDRLIFMRSSREGGSDRPEPEVYVIDRDGTDEQRICEGRWPDWSPRREADRLLARRHSRGRRSAVLTRVRRTGRRVRTAVDRGW